MANMTYTLSMLCRRTRFNLNFSRSYSNYTRKFSANPLFGSSITREEIDARDSISNQTQISLQLAQRLASTEANEKNLVFSPLSINVVLGMIAAGAKGETVNELLNFLKSKSVDELNSLSSLVATQIFADGGPLGGPRLNYSNGVWVDQSLSFKARFKDIVDNIYKATSSRVDFRTEADQVRSEVNLWAEKQTSGLIKEILPPDSVDASTRLIFANAVYFNGAWDQKFNASSTKDHDFFLLNGTSVQVPFMSSREEQYISSFDGFKILRLPYKQGKDKREFSLYFLLPDAKDGLQSLVEKVSSDSGFIERHLPYRKVRVGEFRIPKFKLSFGFEASKVLKDMGVVLPFSFYCDDLTEIVEPIGGENLYVSYIFHKSFIEVNEKGTRAAASSVATFALGCSQAYRYDKLDFIADHPFLFIIREDTTGIVLFVGHVLNPLLG